MRFAWRMRRIDFQFGRSKPAALNLSRAADAVRCPMNARAASAAPALANTPAEAVVAVATWASAATRRGGIREEIEATVTRGPGMDQRVEAVFDRLFWLAFIWPGS